MRKEGAGRLQGSLTFTPPHDISLFELCHLHCEAQSIWDHCQSIGIWLNPTQEPSSVNMGRWGHRQLLLLCCSVTLLTERKGVFEGDNDNDLKSDVLKEVSKRLKAEGLHVDNEQLTESLDTMQDPEFRPTSSSVTSQQLRDHLNHIGGELFLHFRNNPDFLFGEYTTVMCGAVMMEAGIRISAEDRIDLRQAAQRTPSYPGYQNPLMDMGFLDPGKAQFLAALEHYEDDKPQDFKTPRYTTFNPPCFR